MERCRVTLTIDEQIGVELRLRREGAGLTVVEAGATSFTISLIPETLARTTLGSRQPGDRVNLEIDVIARYLARLVDAR